MMWAFWVALAVMIVGLIGVVLPLLPGVALIWLAALGYAIAEGFQAIDPLTFTVLTLLALVGLTADVWMSQLGATVGGASLPALLAGLGLGIVGFLVGLLWGGIGAVPGAIVGALLGVFLVELRKAQRQRDASSRGSARGAVKAAGGWALGCLLSGAVQLVIGVVMILIFVWQVLRG